MKAILATNNLGFIGKGNGMLWRSREDFKHFKSLTTKLINGKIPLLIVGYNTSLELPDLKNREIVIDGRGDFYHYRHLQNEIDWCIGGKKTYEKYCKFFTELHISHINNNQIGNVTFPDLSNLNPNCKIYNYFFEAEPQ